MAYYEAGIAPGGALTVKELPIPWRDLPPTGSDPSSGASTATIEGVRLANTALLLARVAPGGHIAEHAASADGMAFVLSGSGSLGLPGAEALKFISGDAIFVRANVSHSWDAAPDSELLLGVAMLA